MNNKDATKLAMETPEQHQYQSDECVLNFEPISHIVHFEQVNTGWVQPRWDSCWTSINFFLRWSNVTILCQVLQLTKQSTYQKRIPGNVKMIYDPFNDWQVSTETYTCLNKTAAFSCSFV